MGTENTIPFAEEVKPNFFKLYYKMYIFSNEQIANKKKTYLVTAKSIWYTENVKKKYAEVVNNMNENLKKRLPVNIPLTKIPFGGLTSNMLRTIAVLLMLSDHIWATYMSFGNWMTYIGRMAFPIFAFQIAEGFVHTSDFRKYALRLLGFALVTELPFNLFYCSRWFNPYRQNVLFTLLLGLLAIYVLDRLKNNFEGKNITLSLLWIALICIASVIGFADYGFLGVLTVVMFYILRDFPFAWLGQLVAMVLINIVFFEGQVFPVEIFGKAFEIPSQGFAVFALIPIRLYGGKKGKSSKFMQYGFYAFYPAHMLVLYLIKYFA